MTVPLLTLSMLLVTSAPLVLDGAFGRAEVDPLRPALASLVLRQPSGALEPQSLLAPAGSPWPRGVAAWGEEGYTYVVDADGRRYESRANPPGAARREADRLVLDGVTLAAGRGEPPVAVERWVLRSEGSALSWTIERRWLVDSEVRLAGTPGLFSSFRRQTEEQLLPNAVTHTLWVRPDQLSASFEPLYRAWPADYKLSLDNAVVVADPDTWAVAKLWTGWHAQVDLRLAAHGGHLYRRGFFGWRAELGAVSSAQWPRSFRAGQTERITLRLAPSDKYATGYQLAVSLPDKPVERTMASFYGSLLNGGLVNDQKHFDFGNETDGWYYDGSTWMQGLALAAGVPATGGLASKPYDVATAFRGHLAAIVGTVNAAGVGNFGYDWGGSFADARLNNAIGAREYLMHSGDLAFIRQLLPDLERGVGWFAARRNGQGLVDLGAVGHWYYDAMPASGITAYHNALFYRACRCLAEMAAAAGNRAMAERHTRLADQVKAAYAAVLWNERAPGGPRLTDWIAHDGQQVTYAADVCQFPAVAFGLLTGDQSRRLLATLDRRIGELERDYGYTGMASLSAYWPVPDHINTLPWQRSFPIYMNCGSFLGITYYEVMARLEAGDVDGAWARMRRLSQGLGRHSGAGNNWVTVKGEVAAGADEPYLSDMVVLPAALVRGFLGIEPTWDRLIVRPRLPRGWTGATAEVLWKGVRQRVAIRDGQVTITPLDRAFTPPAALTWEVRPAAPAEWQMTVSRHWANGAVPPTADPTIELDGGRHVALRRQRPERGLVSAWRLDAAHALRAEGPVAFGQAGPTADRSAAVFAGQSHLVASDPGWYSFSPGQSFTLQTWFRTEARDIRVMLARPEAYCLYVKDGRLAAWVMQDGLAHREALGSAVVADGAWHHAAAVVDRGTQRLSLYVDGRLDTAQTQPTAVNPVDITPIGLSSSPAPLCLGGLGQGFRFVGALADARVDAGALAPADFAYPRARSAAEPPMIMATTGSYLSSVCDWGQPVAVRSAVVEAALRGGRLEAEVEFSDDGFGSVGQRVAFSPADGRSTSAVAARAWRFARVRFRLSAARNGSATPELRYLKLTGGAEPWSR
ncbi:MAG: hypothetical protein HZB16_18590 [Armatimonadetes bacterium]|nr:hypothetical protein [Armatimonadota bacterium]